MSPMENTRAPSVNGPRMIVPMQTDCLLVGTKNQKTNWAKLGLNYDELLKGGAAFTTDVSPNYALETGAHLHFTMPKALRHGTQNADGVMTYPDLPNRWLVTRILTTPANAKPQLTSWIIESDYLTEAEQDTPAQWLLNTAKSASAEPQLVAKGIGRSMPLAQWSAAPLADAAQITVSAPGSIRWAAAYSGSQNVLSFHDPLSDYDSVEGDPISIGYMIMGWYQPVTQDPFASVAQAANAADSEARWQQIMTELAWTLAISQTDAEQDWEKWLAEQYPSGASTEWIYPSQMLCNSVYLDMQWSGKDHDYTPATAAMSDLSLSVGLNSSQALAAWLSAPDPSEATGSDALTTAQKNTLLTSVFGSYPTSAYSNPVDYASKAQANTFAPQPGGSQWVVRPANENSSAPGTLPSGSSAISVELSSDAQSLLIELNENQATQDRINDDIADLNWRLFAVSYLKKQAQDQGGGTTAPYEAALARFKTDLAMQQANLVPVIGAIESLKAQLAQAVGSTFQILQSPLSQFVAPTDPTVIVAGKGIAKKDPTTASTGLSSLEVRATGETLSELSFSWTNPDTGNTVSGSVSASTLFSDLGLTGSNLLPVEYTWLLAEAILLNPGNAQYLAGLIATQAGQELSTDELQSFGAAISDALTKLYPAEDAGEDHDPVKDAATYFTGVAPSQVGVSLSYQAPWSPLVLDWTVNWYPEVPQDSEVSSSNPVELTGQTILNASAFATFAARLQNFISPPTPTFSSLSAAEQAFLSAAETASAGQDVLIQTLAGFEDTFLGRKQQMSVLTSNDPVIRAAILAAPSAVPSENSAFSPLRSGHFEFTGAYLADAYGQVLTIVGEGQSGNPTINIPPDLASDAGTQFVALGDALVQPSKLTTTLMSAQNFPQSDGTSAPVPVNSASATSPIIGWLLPNRLEQSLMVFEGDGTPAGTVRSIYTNSSAGMRWETAPGQPISLGSLPTVQHPLFQQMLTGLIETQLSEGDAALESFLQLAALSSWTISAHGGQPLNGALQNMLGTPIAVVSAKLAATQKGPQLIDPAALTDTTLPPSPIAGLDVTCSLGDFELSGSGVLGAYVHQNFSEMVTAKNYQQALPEMAAASVNQSLQRASSDQTSAYLNTSGSFTVPLSSDQSPTEVDVVVLVDPRGQIPVSSPLLPVSWSQLTPQMIAPALQNMSANFRSGPILTPAGTISLPLPGGTQGQWQWVEVKGTGWATTSHLLTPNPSPQLSTTPATIRDGWLSLPNAEN